MRPPAHPPHRRRAAAAGTGTGGCRLVRERVAWLLRANRVFGPDEHWAKASEFAQAFPGGCWAGTADGGKISRWETAKLRVPHQAVRRYEDLLQLTPGLLTSTAGSLHGYYCADPGCPAADGRSTPRRGEPPVERISALIDKARSDDVMTGPEWDELTREISAVPFLFIAPSGTWADLAERLLREQLVADDVAWLHRFGAFVRLLGHPVGQRSAAAACAGLAADRTNQAGIEAISTLDTCAHPDAGRYVLGQLDCPTTDHTFYGALLACVRKLARGHFSPGQITRLSSVVAAVLDGLDRDAAPDDARTLAAALLRQMPASLPGDLAGKLRRSLAADEDLDRVVRTGRLAAGGDAAGSVRRVVSAAAARMPREGPWLFDETLAALVDEMLCSPVPDVRLYASIAIRATPYCEPVGSALAAELLRISPTAHADVACRILDALRAVGGAPERPVVERFILNPGLPSPVVAAAARNIGHLGGTSDDRYWTRALRLHRELHARQGSAANGAILRGLVYGLGIAWNDTVLGQVRDDHEMPGQARAAASWWLGHPGRIRRSAVR